jgi:hypothetical protein
MLANLMRVRGWKTGTDIPNPGLISSFLKTQSMDVV